MTTWLHELRFAFRSLRRSTGFVVVGIITLALGIGANTAMFSVVRAVLLNPAPYPVERAEDVYVVKETYGADVGVSYLDFRDWQKRSQSFETLAAFRPSSGNLTNVDEPFRVDVLMATWDYFALMGAQPALGRFFTPAEDSPGGPATAVLSHSLWINRFGGDADVIGKTVHLNLRPRVVIGVLPADFELIPTERLYVDLSHFGASRNRRDDHERIHAVGRLKPGVTPERAQAEMTAIASAIEQEYPLTNSGVGAVMSPLRDYRLGDAETTLLLLFGAAGLVLLIACSNVANLQIARSAGSLHETAVRAALGASRERLVFHGVAESLLVSLLGSAAGLGLTAGLLAALESYAVAELPRGGEIALDWTAVVFAVTVSTGVGMVFGLGPALRSADGALGSLRSGPRLSDGKERLSFRRAFLFAQVTLAMLLLAGAGLLVRTVQELRAVDPGFQAANLLSFRLTRFGFQGGTELPRETWSRVKQRLQVLPGVEEVSFALNLPLRGAFQYTMFRADDRPEPSRAEMPVAVFTPIDPDYFEALGVRLVLGRLIAESDHRDAAPVMVINERLERRFWPDGDAIGRRIRMGRPEQDWQRWTEIVGVVESARQDGLDQEPKMEIFVPLDQRGATSARFVVRTSGPPTALLEPVRRTVREAAPNLPIDELTPMDQLVESSLAPRRLILNLFLAFAGIALVLAATGLYGVLAHAVVRRTREIGLRIAVGADMPNVVRLVLRQELPLVLVAVACGIPAAALLSRSMESVLFSVGGTDPLALGAAATVLLAAAFAACVIPAFRAASIQPTIALRHE